VDLVARVTGYLQSVNFEEGRFVKEGQLLLVIEPDSYEQQLKLSQAALVKAQAEYDRQLGLMKENATSAANVENWRCQRDQAAANVELAKLNLSYTHVTAPFAGRIGRRYVDPGNLVSPIANTKLATLERYVPMYVYFSVNERDVLRLLDDMRRSGDSVQASTGTAPVFAGLQTEKGYPHKGILDFTDNGVNTSTGAIQMRATFKNEDGVLFPGLFARVRIPVDDPKPMLVVPNSALGNDQEGDYVLVADKDNVVARRSVVKGPLTAGGCAIRKGLKPDDRVIVVGLLRAKPGEKVTPVNATSDSTKQPK
jgi:RND family efflux transporter MFP subunit